MSKKWLTTAKPSFNNALFSLAPTESHKVIKLINLLVDDPHPDGHKKIKLQSKSKTPVYRTKGDKWRLFYTYDDRYVSLLALRKRGKDTYKDEVPAEDLGGLDAEVPEDEAETAPNWQAKAIEWSQPQDSGSRPLPEPVTAELLTRLKIDPVLHVRLLPLKDEDAVYAVPGVPDEQRLRLIEYMFEPTLENALAQPDFVVPEVDDLLRFKEGTLHAFLLKLNPEQEKVVDWAIAAKGPTLVKGSPGTGKSTVALYRVRSILERLPESPAPRVLFTTYTNALVASSTQLLGKLLGKRAEWVHVRTADSLAREVVKGAHGAPDFISDRALRKAVAAALARVELPGAGMQQRALRRALERLGVDYTAEEISRVIEARGLATLDEYREASRNGRRVSLGKHQREAVWLVRDELAAHLERERLWTWQRLRRRASELVREGKGPQPYDAVVIDEAQDLDPCLLRMLTDLCAAPGRLFVTADANQSIYGSGFRWTNVHDQLKFQGRTSVLRANHRSTREISEAARSFLRADEAAAALEPTGGEVEPEYVHEGAVPVVRTVGSRGDEASLVARFVRGATRHLHLGPGSGAVLVPTEWRGRDLAQELSDRGLPARFMSGRELDLDDPAVKVITLKSAKGLEFPVVAVAGFVGSNHPMVPPGSPPGKEDEVLAEERRTLYVAMTRAMRALLVVIPANPSSLIFEGFDPALWNTGTEAHS